MVEDYKVWKFHVLNLTFFECEGRLYSKSIVIALKVLVFFAA